MQRTLTTRDGESIAALYVPRSGPVCFVLAHGFTGNWREARVQKVITVLAQYGAVIAVDMRGHGRSSGRTSLGDEEVHDVQAGVAWARELGYMRVVLIGFSLGGAVVLRAAALAETGELDHRVDAVVSVSAPAFWYYRGTRITDLIHTLVLNPIGRQILRLRGTRITTREWTEPLPVAPHEAAALLGAVPLLVVHGDVDHYFPLEHPEAITRAATNAGVDVTTWIEPGFAHAETSITPDALNRIAQWAVARVGA